MFRARITRISRNLVPKSPALPIAPNSLARSLARCGFPRRLRRPATVCQGAVCLGNSPVRMRSFSFSPPSLPPSLRRT